MQKIEIIARITEDDTRVEEEILMTWSDTGHWYLRPVTSNIGLDIILLICNNCYITLVVYERSSYAA